MSDADRALLIPIALRACMRGRKAKVDCDSGFLLDFSTLGDQTIPIDNGLFTHGDYLQSGVHLHWSLPEGFAHGQQVEDETGARLVYPPVPNRWMVARLWSAEGADAVSVKLFMVESDALLKRRNADACNLYSSNWPFLDDPDRPYRYLGRSYPAQSPPKDAEIERLQLTAVSPVNPYFSAYYPHCRNVFGFHDDLAGIVCAAVSYMVCGWFAGAGDPLQTVFSLEALEALLMSAPDGTWPARSVCHGLIGDLPWRGADADYPSGLPDDPEPGVPVDRPVFAVGNTSQEAAAALVRNGSSDNARLFHCFLENLHVDLTAGQGAAPVEDELFATGFSSILPPDLPNIAQLPGADDSPPPTHRTLRELFRLRARQRALFQQRAALAQCQRAAYERWQQYARADAGERPALLRPFEQAAAIAKQAAQALSDAEAAQKDALSAFDPGAGYELRYEPDARFYQPTEPVVLIKQLANTDGKVTGSATRCREASQCVTAISVDLDATVTISGEALLEGYKGAESAPAELRALLAEAAVLSPGCAPQIARRALAACGMPATPEQVKRRADRIRLAQANPDSLPDIRFRGDPPAAASDSRYRPQWHPLYMEWQCAYYPDHALLTERPILSNWRLTENRYDYVGSRDILLSKNARPVEGRLLNADNAAQQLARMVEKHLPDAAPLAADPRAQHILSQSLSGFQDRLMMRDQMDLLALFSEDAAVRRAAERIADIDPAELSSGAVFDQLFSPIRAGFIAFEQIMVLDKLGRFQRYNAPDLYLGESMRAPGAADLAHHAMLQPRLLQPTRMNARFLCADPAMATQEASFVEAASPLCGFVITNRLDHSLMAYDASGRLIGSLILTGTRNGIAWKSPPGQRAQTRIPRSINPHLYGMLSRLRAAGPAALRELIDHINHMCYQITPQAMGSADVELIGRPLALARLGLKLEQLGPRERYRHIPGQPCDATAKTDVNRAVFPVRLGRPSDHRDGLIGFYLGGDYDHLLVDESAEPRQPYFTKRPLVDAAADPAQPWDAVCALMDPHAALTVTPAILPTFQLMLPPELVSAALRNIHTAFFAAPVISDAGRPTMPAPYLDNKRYVFYQARGQDWTQSELSRHDAQAFTQPYPQQALEGYVQIFDRKEVSGDD